MAAGEAGAAADIADARAARPGRASRALYRRYSASLRRAVDNVFGRRAAGLPDRLRASLAEFAAAKALRATEALRAAPDDEAARAAWRRHNRWHATEFQTAQARAQTARQWQRMDSGEALPNIRWLPSRAADPRPEHRAYWGRVWAKADPFWAANAPGNLWGCRCDWEETDDPPTAAPPAARTAPAPGLSGNPGVTGRVFSADHPYFGGGATRIEAARLAGAEAVEWAARTLPTVTWATTAKGVELKARRRTIGLGGDEAVVNVATFRETANKGWADADFTLRMELTRQLASGNFGGFRLVRREKPKDHPDAYEFRIYVGEIGGIRIEAQVKRNRDIAAVHMIKILEREQAT